MMMALLETKGLGFEYPDGSRALYDVDLSIEKGSRTALIGPNGSGKTTLLHHLVGLLNPTSGSVWHKGKMLTYDKRALTTLRRSVGMLFQNPDDQLFAPTVEKDVAFGPMNLGLPKEEVDARVRNTMELIGIAGLAHKAPHLLSVGEKKRVAIAGLIATEPEVLLLDEPLSSLDPRGVDSFMSLLEILNRERDIALIYTGHGLDPLSKWADDLYVLEEGGIAAKTSPGEIIKDREQLKTWGLIRRRT